FSTQRRNRAAQVAAVFRPRPASKARTTAVPAEQPRYRVRLPHRWRLAACSPSPCEGSGGALAVPVAVQAAQAQATRALPAAAHLVAAALSHPGQQRHPATKAPGVR
ncbi:hypothetical protein MTO96_034023, partial [Rhipicephalus appendiculatus]